jgi:hypothetical protein
LSEKPDERPTVNTMLTCFKNAMLSKQKGGAS